MGEHTTRRRLLQVTGTAALGGLTGCSGDSGSPGATGTATISVRIENVAPTDYYPSDSSTGGELRLSPGVYATQQGFDRIIPAGEPASVGVEALAEAGDPTGFEGEDGLVDEAERSSGVVSSGRFGRTDTVEDPNDPRGAVPGAPPIAPGGAFEFEIETRSARQLFVASMVIPSNDIFIAPEEWITPWPSDATPIEGDVTDSLALWDAGTEPNQQPGFGSDQPPSQESPDQGGDEDGVVRKLSAVDDGSDYPAVEELVAVTLSPQ